MYVLAVGLNHRTAPVEIREKFTFTEQDKQQALQQLHHASSIYECMILATCNRTEIYTIVDQLHTGRHCIKCFLSKWFDVSIEDYVDFLQFREADAATRHLFRVSCGLDSMVLGETQILGQVKEAFELAQTTGTTGKILNTLVKQSITLAKRAHTETGISQNAVSISYAAIELGKKVFNHFRNKKAMLIGAGQMSELTAKHLCENGVSHMLVANRTYERAQALAEKFQGRAYALDHLEQALLEADIVVSSTGAKEYILTKQDVMRIMKNRRKRPLFMIDIAVPRDLDPAINELEGVYLYNIDDLEGIVEINMQARAKEAEKVGFMIEAEQAAFKGWMHTLGVTPIITALRERLLSKQEESVQSIIKKCPDLTENQIRMINKHTKVLINQILHDPIVCLKELSGEAHSNEAIQLFVQMFALQAATHQEADRRVDSIKEEAPCVPWFGSESTCQVPASIPTPSTRLPGF